MSTPEKPDRPKSRLEAARMTQIFGRLTEVAPEKAKVVTNDLDMKLALIPAGSFGMGADPEDEAAARDNEGPRHSVVLTKEYYIGVYPVSQAEYERVARANPSQFTKEVGGGPDHPVERVSWDDAQMFCRRLSAFPGERAAGRVYRLPTEAEWECACRAGGVSAFAFGEELSLSQANVGGGYGPDGLPKPPALGRTTPVGAYPANHYGLYDLHGNVWEWCQDWYGQDYYVATPLSDPPGPEAGRFRVARGGCWRSHPGSCRSAYRNALVPNNRDPYTGFRVVAVVT